MKLQSIYLAAAAVAAFFFGAVSRGQDRYDLKVRNDFFTGMMGDAAALERGMKAAEATLAENPKHAEALVWHGGGLYYLAGQAFMKGDPKKGMELAQKAIEEMDRAVELAPDDVAVRVPRGATLLTATRYQQGPHVQALLERAAADFAHTYKLQASYIDKLGEHPKGELLFALADANARMGEKETARGFYERATKEMPGTVYAKYAAEWLETGKLEARKAGCLGCHSGK
jgi:predicted Zn-dependent protease